MSLILFTATVAVMSTLAADLPQGQAALDPLIPITWTVYESIENRPRTATAISLRAEGKKLDLNYRELSIEKRGAYPDPLTCCVAAITARIDVDEAWWGDLCAPKEARDASGQPLAGFVADSESNLFKMYTFHTENPEHPHAVDARFLTYLRVGGMHAFDIEWTVVAKGVTGPPRNGAFAIQEFSPGLYRFAPEWLGPNEKIVPFLKRTQDEDKPMVTYRTSEPSKSHEVPIYGLFGAAGQEYPLTILFRGLTFAETGKFQQLARCKSEIAAAVTAVSVPRSPAEDQRQKEQLRAGLSAFLTPESLAMFEKQGSGTRGQVPFVEDTAFIIDGGSVLFAYGRDEKSGVLQKNFRTFVEENGRLLLANYNHFTLLDKFLKDDRIWLPLSQTLDEISKRP